MPQSKRVTVEDRERTIFRFLKALEDPTQGATVKDIWQTVSGTLQDSVTQQAYYKLLDRLEAVGKLDVVDHSGDGGRRYRVAPYLNPENAVSLDDVYELLDVLAPTEAIARFADARRYFEERRPDTLAKAAKALLEEDPRDLMFRMIEHKVRAMRADLEMLRERELADLELEARVDAQFRELNVLAYRYLGLSRECIDIIKQDEIKIGKHEVHFDSEALARELQSRVFGETVIAPVDVSEVSSLDEWRKVAVAGSDGSTHGGVLQLSTASTFLDDIGHQVITFNNSVVYVDVAEVMKDSVSFPYYSVPPTRAALDDPGNRGMVLAPFMFRDLSESEYEHMAKCATDVVQWRADEMVFLGTARSLGDGKLLPRPLVHFRDGTITPQEREWGHYRRDNAYGDMVREGIVHSRNILEKVVVADNRQVFAGAVKATQIRFFVTLLNWYITRGSRRSSSAEPLDPNWDTTRAAHISDNEAMSLLLSTLEDRRREGLYYTSCVVMRPFHTLTEFYRTPAQPDFDWIADFDRRKNRAARDYEEGLSTEAPYLTSVPNLSDESYVVMLRRADYASFYVGHTAGEPPPTAPRYEFRDSLRGLEPAAARERVERSRNLIVAALHKTKLTPDMEHNFMSKKHLVRIVPYVVFEAHEKCKALGRRLEAELRSIAVARLQQLQRSRSIRPSDVEFLPLPISRFLEKYKKVLDDDERRRPDSGPIR